MKEEFLKINCQCCPSRGKSIFCEFLNPALAQVDLHKITDSYQKGEKLFLEGSPSRGLYCIRSGVIKLTKKGLNGKESITRLATAGDVIGHKSLFQNEVHQASAIVLQDAVVCYLDRSFVQQTILKEPSAAFHILQTLSRDIGEAENRMTSLIRKSAQERIIELLIFLKNTFGIKETKGKVKIDLILTREEIASLVGTTHETAIRCLTELKAQGILKQEGRYLFILKESELEKLAE